MLSYLFLFIAHLYHACLKLLYHFWLQSLYRINVLFFNEKVVNIISKLLQTLIDNMLHLISQTDFDFPLDLAFQLLSYFFRLLDIIRFSVFIVVLQHFINDSFYVISELIVQFSFRFFKFISELLFEFLISFLFGFMTFHIR